MVLTVLLACSTAPAGGGDSGPGSADSAVEPLDSGDTGVLPEEVCNGADDDGDGAVDEDGAAGCTDRWTDGDGDGLGGGAPRCRCTAEGVGVGGDCDDTDRDRGADCTEGEARPVSGARLLHDDATDYYNFTDLGAFGPAGEPGLLLWAPGATVVVADPPSAGDVPLSAARHATLDYPSQAARPVVGDLDGDGLPDLVSLDGALLAEGDGACTYAAEVALRAGPLVDDHGLAWTTALDALRLPTCNPTLTAFVGDLDGAAGAELWLEVGTEVDEPGPGFVARVDAGGAVTPLAAWSADPGRLALAPAGDLDGDGFVDLVRVDGTAAETDLRVHLGPLAALPDAAAADGTLVAGPGVRPTALGDVSGDGVADLALTDHEDVWLVSGLAGGPLAGAAWATVGAETDGEGNLVPSAADLGAGPALVVADTWWPASTGPGNLRGAVYLFATPPLGHVDARSAALRVVGEDFGAFGAFVAPLGDGRLVAGANLQATDVGTGVTWLFAAE